MSSTLESAVEPGSDSAKNAHAEAALARKPRRVFARIFGAISAVALVAWLIHVGLHAYRYVETDDAYIVGHLHEIGPMVSGQVKEILVEENQLVKAGDVLVRLDAREFEIALERASAALEQARAQEAVAKSAVATADAQIAEAEARVAQAEAQVTQAHAQQELARINLERAEQLFAANGGISKAELDNAGAQAHAADAAHSAGLANVTAARAGRAAAQAVQASARAQVAAASAAIDAATASVRDAERALAYTTLTAPADGRVGNRSVEIGNRVVAGQALFALAATKIWVVANFKETQLARMERGQEVELTVDALPGRELKGHVESFSPASGSQFALLPPDNATGNFNKVVQRLPVKITLDAETLAAVGDRLRLGLSVVVNVRVR